MERLTPHPLFLPGALFLVLVAMAWAGAIEVPSNLDFFALYDANRALFEQGSPYRAEAHTLPPFLYPAYVSVLSSPLAFFSPDTAAHLWWSFNLALLILSAYLLSGDLGLSGKAIGLIGALLFLPTQGVLMVGQFTLWTLAGTVLFFSPRESGARLALGAVCLLVKPHLGLPILCALLLSSARELKARLVPFSISLAALLALSLAIVPDWPAQYIAALQTFSKGMYVTCPTCVSIPRLASTSISIIGALAVFVVLVLTRHKTSHQVITANVVSAVLLFSPYVRNYDYVLLLYPLFVLWNANHSLGARATLTLAYCVAFTPLITESPLPLLLSALLTLGVGLRTRSLHN